MKMDRKEKLIWGLVVLLLGNITSAGLIAAAGAFKLWILGVSPLVFIPLTWLGLRWIWESFQSPKSDWAQIKPKPVKVRKEEE